MDNAERKTAIATLLEQGFTVYYFALGNFESETSRDITENILTAADGTGMKMIGILLPPSEAGSGGNYDWEGWVDYLNSLKEGIHPWTDLWMILIGMVRKFKKTTKKKMSMRTVIVMMLREMMIKTIIMERMTYMQYYFV